MILTNARTGKRFVISADFIGTMEARNDEAYPNTKTVIVKKDGNFIPVAEDDVFCIDMYERELRSMRGSSQPVQRMQVQRPEPEGHPDER